jgi:hypothetical protein
VHLAFRQRFFQGVPIRPGDHEDVARSGILYDNGEKARIVEDNAVQIARSPNAAVGERRRAGH